MNPFPLYDPVFEHDACGVGFVANLSGGPSSAIVHAALRALCNLAHRGAVAADAQTGDGAGILTGLPTEFFLAQVEGLKAALDHEDDLGVGMLFMPRHDEDAYGLCKALVEHVLAGRRLRLLGWRTVPTDLSAIGEAGAANAPVVQQVFVQRPHGMMSESFERALYLARKEMERHAAKAGMKEFYACSFSSRTIVYKGLMLGGALDRFYADLRDPLFTSMFAVYHQRYSTNTFPTWHLAQPFRMLGHNGEINTIQGNRRWTEAREATLASEVWGEDLRTLRPILQPGGSDSANLDNVLELLTLSGRTAQHAMLMLVPEAWQQKSDMNPRVREFFEFQECFSEPWDGPAAVVFADGKVVGATLDRNGLRPARYKITSDGFIYLGSEAGALPIDDARVVEKGKLGPGEMILVDLERRILLRDLEIKQELSRRRPYGDWLRASMCRLQDIAGEHPASTPVLEREALLRLQLGFGYSEEELQSILRPMMTRGEEPIGSMGDDAPLAVLSAFPKLLPSYFKQQFAQVTNPPLDPIRERLVMSLSTNIGPRGNWLGETPAHAHQIKLATPVLFEHELDALLHRSGDAFTYETLSLLFPADRGEAGLRACLDELAVRATAAAQEGKTMLVLSDRGVNATMAPAPALLAVGAVHSHLLRQNQRLSLSIVVETGEPRDVHQIATLIGYGANAVCPYLALESIRHLSRTDGGDEAAAVAALERYRKALEKGLLKIISKMGISLLGSYRGAQIFEALGISDDVVGTYFPGTPSRIGGMTLAEIAREACERHAAGFKTEKPALTDPGQYRFRKNGERHAWSPDALRAMQHMRTGNADAFSVVRDAVTGTAPIGLKDLMEFRHLTAPVPVDEVEPVEQIRKRFTTAAMSLGSLSPEAHETIARAMNRIGGKSNTGEGGEDPARFHARPDGESANSAIKQVASARFGVTAEYLANAKEIEIKMAQGSKPGEGGQIPADKVTVQIAALRRSLPGIALISPPPHHDIYSIEDLAQLIYDLKQVNPRARIAVKLVAEAGVGTIAAGVAKAYADVIQISGHEGGTGASPLSSVKNCGGPWELGLAEIRQVLVKNGLRGRVTLRVDGGFKTGRDVVIAAMLGAEEFNFGTAALIAIGCRYVRQCHLNTCPVGIATQDETLRKKFPGTPEDLIRYFDAVAQDVRETLASLGVRSLDDIIGRTEYLQQKAIPDHPKANGVDLSRILARDPSRREEAGSPPPMQTGKTDRPLDDEILFDVKDALREKVRMTKTYHVTNVNRSLGTKLSGEVAYLHGGEGLPAGTIELRFHGSAGQSLGAFLVNGVRIVLSGEANDYVGKGMSGGEIVVHAPAARVNPSVDVIAGNTILYGATGGSVFIAGRTGERFCVRNSGATAVCEGVGDHGCEYMTNGLVAVLGRAGRNFGAGMTGGRAYVLDVASDFPQRINTDYVRLKPLTDPADQRELQGLIQRHIDTTASERARDLLNHWEDYSAMFWKVEPVA